MKLFLKSLLIFIGLLAVLALGAHYYLSYNAKKLLQTIVSRVSNETYRLEAESITFFYRNAGVSGHHIRLVPLVKNQKQASLSLERVEIRLQSLWHLLVNRKLEVKTIELIKPDVTAYAKKDTVSQQKGIPATIYDIQLKLFEIIDVLRVEKLLLSDAALKIYTSDSANARFFAVNHLTLKLDSILVLPSTNPTTPQIELEGALTLLNPSIHLPDTHIVAKLGRLEASLSRRSLEIDELDFSISSPGRRTQKLVLSSIQINQFNWNRFVNEGLLELDTVWVNKGMANLSLAPKKNLHPADAALVKPGYTGSPLIIHHTLISDVVYNLSRTDGKHGKSKQVKLNLRGDSLYFEDFSLVSGREPVVDVEKLAIAIRNVEHGDSEEEVRFTLGALGLDSNALVLKDYRMETNVQDKSKSYMRVAIPSFRLSNYSLEEIFQKRIAATSIHLYNPEIAIEPRQKKKVDNAPKKNLDAVFAGLMESVSSRVALQEIEIENGSFTLLSAQSAEDPVTISGISLILDAAKFPEIKDAHDFINAIRRLNSKGFFLKGKNMELTIENMELLKVPRGIYFGSVKGNFGKGKNIDLQGVTVLINDSISNYRRTNDFHASAVLVESGNISLDLIKKDGTKKASGNAPSLLIDTLELKNMVFSMRQGTTTGVSAALDIAAADFVFKDKDFYWKTLVVNAANPGASLGATKFKAGNLSMVQPGIIQVRQASGSKSTPYSDIDFKTETLDIKLGLRSTDIPSLAVEDIEMIRPELKIALRRQQKSKDAPLKSGKPFNQDISLKSLRMTEPSVDLTLSSTEGKTLSWHKVYTGSFTLEDIHTINQPEIRVGKLRYSTTQPKNEIGGTAFNPSSVQLNLSNLLYNTVSNFYSLHVDTVQVKGIAQTVIGKKQDTLQLDAGTIGAGDFDFAKGDSITAGKLLYGTKWWLRNANVHYRTALKSMQAHHIHASGIQTISLALDSFAILNRLSKEEVWQASPFEKGYETITGGKLSLSGIRMHLENKQPLMEAGKMIAENLHFTTSKDKTKPEDTVTYRPLLTQMFTRIPLKMKLDSLLLSNARVDAHEISKKTGKETHIFFSEINGYLHNVKTWDIQEPDTLDMRVRARFYGTDLLRLHFRQSYYDSLQGFWMRVRMSHFNMPEMNKLLTPLMGLNIESGTIDSLLLVANGNDYFAYGTMDLRYHDLHAKLLKTEETKGKFLISIGNFFVGMLLPKHDNGRTDLLFKERLRKRSIFNFWAKIGLEGLLTNLGIKKDKKERRQFERTIEKFNLPEKYWDDIDDY